MGLPRWLSGKESTCQCRRHKRRRFYPWLGKIPWRRKWQPSPVFLPGKSHGWRSLAGYSPWGHKELDTTEHTHRYCMVGPCCSPVLFEYQFLKVIYLFWLHQAFTVARGLSLQRAGATLHCRVQASHCGSFSCC